MTVLPSLAALAAVPPAALAAVPPAALAAVVAIASTRAIERWGGRTGGVLATIPTTIVPASLGIALAGGPPEDHARAMFAVPAGMLLNALYLHLWRWLPPRLPPGPGRLLRVLGLALAAWMLGALLVVSVGAFVQAAGLPLLPLAGGTALALLLLGLWACRALPPAPRGLRPVGWGVLLARGLLAALAVGGAVLIARDGHPLLAGLASVFPAIFTTTMVSLWLSQGEAVPTGAVGPMMLGSASVAAFALAAALLVPRLGPGLGEGLAWLLAVLGTSLPAGLWLRRRREGIEPAG